MADIPIRRQITIVVELDETGVPVEINRAFSSDEYVGRSGTIEVTPAANVTAETLVALLPDTAATIAQLAEVISERDEATRAVSEANAEIEQLKAQLAAITPTPATDESIHAAYVKQALDDMKRIDEVVGAAIAAGYYQLWDNATAFTLEEPMVVAIASNLAIDLAEVRARALAIKNAVPLSGNSGE